jgi:hypothetical protein
LGEVAVEVVFGGFFEKVAEAVCAVGFPLLEQVQGEDELPFVSVTAIRVTTTCVRSPSNSKVTRVQPRDTTRPLVARLSS